MNKHFSIFFPSYLKSCGVAGKMLQVQITSNNGLRDNHIESGFSVFLWKTKIVNLKSVLNKTTVRFAMHQVDAWSFEKSRSIS